MIEGEKVCRRCQKPHAQVYGGKYPRHVCPPCMEAGYATRVTRRAAVAITNTLRAMIYAEANGLCELCGLHTRFRKADRYDRGNDLAHIDHIMPVKHGGGRSRANLRLLCKGCNAAKGARAPE